jgi:cysteinyl-tRNA synthetase
MLHIHNNLTGKKEKFEPIDKKNVRMYVCGMTVYDNCHIGHARVLVIFDVIYRYLCQIYGSDHVTYVRNVTDIDDNIIKRANENSEDFRVLTHRYIQAMHEDAEALLVLPPTQEPLATAHIDQIIDMIERLIEKGYAYSSGGGDVYYDVSRFEAYGKLSGKQTEDLRAGARVEVNEAKDDPLDFVLWKSAKPEEPSWPSPWGDGRPGWHIECSAMSTHCLGNHFDIHGGGLDLQFPHHENEIAQSEGATGETFVNTWIHNGFVRIDDEKMSKSLGNFFTIKDVAKKYDPEVIRYFILTSHYRSPLNYSDKHLDNAKAALTTFYTTLRGLDLGDGKKDSQNKNGNKSSEYDERFFKTMDDDFNTSEALAVLFDLAHEINRIRASDEGQANALGQNLKQLAGLLGILQGEPTKFLQGAADMGDGLTNKEIEAMVAQRVAARAAKDWAESDRLRDELTNQGIILEDSAGTTSWRRA